MFDFHCQRSLEDPQLRLKAGMFGSVLLLATLLASRGALGATFVVPSDSELIEKASVIVTGVVEGSFVRETNGVIETVYEVRADAAMKGTVARGELVRVVSPGGLLGDRGLLVSGASHFRQGERVLIFLNRANGFWQTVDMTLGKFRFVTSTAGERLLVREQEDVVGWDRSGQIHHEKVRREAGFLRFIADRIHGRAVTPDYEVDAEDVTLPVVEGANSVGVGTESVVSEATAFPAATYTDWVSGQPTRWPNISGGVTFRKVASQNISGLADGGVSAIQNGLAAWNNECGSNINLIYGGTTTTPSTNFDGSNVVEFNDPQSKISGSWAGSGTIGVCFLSFSGSHSFGGGTYWNISDADVVFQNGFPGTHSAFAPAMTHELGHGIGWRHSNQDYSTGGSCNSATQECTSAAIMNSSVSGAYGYTLQPWDINAARMVYPGGSCGSTCVAPAISGPAQRAVTGGTELSVVTTGTTPQTFQWYLGASGNTATPIGGATASWIVVNPASTTSYWVRVTNSCGSANSAAVSVGPACAAPTITGPASRLVSGGTELSVLTTGGTPQTFQWYIGASGSTSNPIAGATASWIIVKPSTATSYWVRVTNSCGARNSAAVTVAPVCVAPSITGPASRLISGGTELSVLTTGTTPQTFQWFRGASGSTSNPISGATGSWMVVAPSTSTTYWVRVSNACGTANSNGVTVAGTP